MDRFVDLESAIVNNLEMILNDGYDVNGTTEVLNASFGINDPKQRLIFNNSRKMNIMYAIGQMMWYLAGDNSLDFIEYYDKSWKHRSDDGKTLNSAYGHKIFKYFGFDQMTKVIDVLEKDKNSRQAIINLQQPGEHPTKDELCTMYLQFFIRDCKLHMIANMRSNDALWGFTYDIYAFTFIQEMLALRLGVDLGTYYHNAGSMHIYDKDMDQINHIINDGVTEQFSEITMPLEFLDNVKSILKDEELIRKHEILIVPTYECRFSRNIIYVLNVHAMKIRGFSEDFIDKYLRSIEDDLYHEYVLLLREYL